MRVPRNTGLPFITSARSSMKSCQRRAAVRAGDRPAKEGPPSEPPRWSSGARCRSNADDFGTDGRRLRATNAFYPSADGYRTRTRAVIFLPMPTTIRVETKGPRADVVLARPDV